MIYFRLNVHRNNCKGVSSRQITLQKQQKFSASGIHGRDLLVGNSNAVDIVAGFLADLCIVHTPPPLNSSVLQRWERLLLCLGVSSALVLLSKSVFEILFVGLILCKIVLY